MGIPERLAERPRWGRYPVSYVTHVREDGRPDFRVHDDAKRWDVARRKLCQLCGQRFDSGEPFVFIGFESSVHRAVFGEPPAHDECLSYALRECPWLSGKPYRSGFAEEVESVALPSGSVLMGVWRTWSFTSSPDPERDGGVVFRPAPCIGRVEWILRPTSA